MRDDAVSPIVAFMLLLMVVVSFISILNAYYIPSLKQQAEIEHLQGVEESFLKISADILQVLTFRQNISMSVPIQLGGGGVYFSPIKSSGYVEINTTLIEGSLANMTIKINGSPIDNLYSEINSSNIIFRPIGNFWINQGYEWKDGVLYIKKGTKRTYLLHIDEKKVSYERNTYLKMFSPRLDYSEYQNNITSIRLDLVNIQNPNQNRSYSSNGVGNLIIELIESPIRMEQPLYNGAILNFEIFESDENIGFNTTLSKLCSICNKKDNLKCSYTDPKKYSLEIPDDAIIQPNIIIKHWNLSIHF